MSLSASLWTSVSGLLAHGERMNVIGNNISNVNTVGFKGQRMDFQDFVYQYVGTAAGVGQVGRGTNIGIIMNDFSEGSRETTTSATDIAISGNGFFKVKPKNNNEDFYTRAGNFTFDREGFLVDPHGYVLQGWAIDRNYTDAMSSSRSNSGIIGSGSPVDVKLDSFTCPPRHTTSMTVPVNLKADEPTVTDASTDVNDPFFALLKTWDATQNPPLGKGQYAHQSTMEVYDEGGKMHKLTIYFDRVTNGHHNQHISGNASGESYWEFVVTMDPSEDMRDFNSVYDPSGMQPANPNVPDKLKGLLGSGTLTFTGGGELKDMSFFVPHSQEGVDADQWWDANGNVKLDHFIPGPISSDGLPMIAPNFTGTAGQQLAYGKDENGAYDYTKPNPHAQDRLIAIDLGLSTRSTSWNYITGPVLPADALATLNTAAMKNGSLLEYGGTTQIVLNGPFYVDDSATRAASADWEFMTDSTGKVMKLYEYADTRPGYPSPHFSTTPLSVPLPDGVTETVHDLWKFVGAGAAPAEDTLPAGPCVAADGKPLMANAPKVVNTRGPIYDETATSWTASYGLQPRLDDTGNQMYLTEYTLNGKNYYTTNYDHGAGSAILPTGATIVGTSRPLSEPNPQILFPNSATGLISAADVGNSKYHINGMDGFAEVANVATTCYGKNFFEHNGMRQDGYTYGDLRYVNVDTNGVLSAAYSNGVTLQLYQITLHDFPSKQNLRREGGNLYSETRESGSASKGAAGTGTFGTTDSYSLEQSNVDLSREFVNMITTQRGFQANSKNITTVDTMLEVVINMKR